MMGTAMLQQLADIAIDNDTIFCHGAWTVSHIAWLSKHAFESLQTISQTDITLDLSHVTHFDLAGACLLNDIASFFKNQNSVVHYRCIDERQDELLSLVTERMQAEPATIPLPQFLVRLGMKTHKAWLQMLVFLSFFGQMVQSLSMWFRFPKRIRWQEVIHQIEITGYQAMGIVALLSFLIGVVLAYQMGTQLQSYGAGIYVVDLLGLSLLREFSPLLTAIIVAGRTGAAFAAQLGTMKLNEEIDALQTLGVDATEVLVLPKLLGLIIALPLLTVLAMVAGVFGGMLMSKLMLGITFVDFLDRFSSSVSAQTLFLGELKTPFFAVLIALIGCFQGFQVSQGAASVGSRTTMSVVQCIFMIITTDAVFSVIYSMLGI